MADTRNDISKLLESGRNSKDQKSGVLALCLAGADRMRGATGLHRDEVPRLWG